MKKHLLMLTLGTLAMNLAVAQPVNVSALPADRPLTKADLELALAGPTNSLTRFDLDFHGGTPSELVKTIQIATGKPLNTVIADEDADVKLPALSLRNVTVAEVFAALPLATTRGERNTWTDYINVNREPQTGSPVTFYYDATYHSGFRTEGVPTENSIWCFYNEKPPVQHDPIICRFYQLAPYLEAGYSVDDITTAVETGWKLLGFVQMPQVTYHKDTKVLIAYGGADKLKTIDDVLKQLKTEKPADKPKAQ